MKNLIKIIALIIIGILSFKLSGCASNQQLEVKQLEVKMEYVLPKKTTPLVLKSSYFFVKNVDDVQSLCLPIDDYKTEVYNYQETIRYIKDLQEENRTLRKLLKDS